ncbi:glycosyltransferase-like protein, family 2 [Leptospira kirschneri str. 200803703]|uniref:glycosyltransferase family 2 protein n=1 Tax=Leptospira kirschneri TaxID=29507 RepID=UPI0002892F55|nr:glycosyltransferase [Leptospira kirschneri]EMK18420.1 glycosyltransferase-like protein, family 2 [Leptospira kirschneri serovar Bim str. PUO 1247]EMN03279.1 glycosyltransferase-like protein, family 2 [Leptospira kirschneri serovar Bim str. 1051]EMO68936.1 glycosyltransferase-like protein, family 2 [Leptospira kirschneri str. 200803703]EMO80911.1 glycosyltransferase-like protein, family 2 [Leptospira kirschneri str. 200801774]EPG48165.1 glycosyltransferase-like protein, family 2 [Leptospira 
MNDVPISVVIPTYNREIKILNAISSVLKQTFSPKEIIVVDDGSTDTTVFKIQETFSDKVQILSLEHKGVSHARNWGVENANEEWIAFLDSDDEWLSEKLEKQWKHIKEHPETEILQSQEIWIRNGKRVNPPVRLLKKDGDIFEQSLEFCSVTPSSVLLKKELYQNQGGMDEKLPACEDYDLWLRITSQIPVALLDEFLLVRYGGHKDQLSFLYPAMDRFRIYSILKLLSSNLLNQAQRRLSEQKLFIKWEVLRQGSIKRNNWKKELDFLLDSVLKEGLDSYFGIQMQEFLLENQNWI